MRAGVKFGVAALLVFALVVATVAMASPAKAMEITGAKGGGKKIKDMYIHERRTKGFVLNNDTFDEAKTFTLAGIDYAIASLESIKEKVESSNLSTKDEIVSEMDSRIAELEACRENVESASTVDELREAVKEVRETWRDARVSIEKAIIIGALDRMEGMLERGEAIENFVEKKIDEFKNESKDTTLLENWLEKFRDDRENALSKVRDAKEKVMEISTLSEAREAVKDVRDAIRNAIQYTRECMKDLREIIELIKEYGDQNDLEDLMGVIEEVRNPT